MVQFYNLSVFGVLFAFLAHASFAHICDVCDCQPSRSGVFSITCGCESNEHLHFTSSMMMGVESAAMVLIKNCQTVSIEKNSFSQLGKLDTLGIQNCLHLYLATGAFSSLNSLLINNVQDISFGEMALMGARGVKNIIINSSNITELLKYSLFDVEGMDRFSFSGVNIGRIHAKAFNVTAKSIAIENLKVNYIEADGLTLNSDKVMIQKSEFDISEPNSVKIVTEFQTRLLENQFRGYFQIQVTSPFAEFFGNRFENFGSSMLADIGMSKIMNNFIFNADFEPLLGNANYKDFHDNEFECRCDMNLLNSSRNSNSYEIFKENYCMSNCSLSLFEFEVESKARCMRDRRVDVNNYCTYERTLKTNHRDVNLSTRKPEIGESNFTEGKIQPRFLILDGNENSAGEKVLGQRFSLFLTISVIFLAIYCY